MSFKIASFPDRQEMRKRLLGVSRDEDLSQRFYPEIIRSCGGHRIVSEGVARIFKEAIKNYKFSATREQIKLLDEHLDSFIDLLLLEEDEETRVEIKELLREALTTS